MPEPIDELTGASPRLLRALAGLWEKDAEACDAGGDPVRADRYRVIAGLHRVRADEVEANARPQ